MLFGEGKKFVGGRECQPNKIRQMHRKKYTHTQERILTHIMHKRMHAHMSIQRHMKMIK